MSGKCISPTCTTCNDQDEEPLLMRGKHGFTYDGSVPSKCPTWQNGLCLCPNEKQIKFDFNEPWLGFEEPSVSIDEHTCTPGVYPLDGWVICKVCGKNLHPFQK